MNMFYKIWVDAQERRNDYIATEVHWSEVPGRDEEWKKETIRNTSESQFNAEFECEFLGSIDTLISAHRLKTLVYRNPIQSNAGLDIYVRPEKDNVYMIRYYNFIKRLFPTRFNTFRLALSTQPVVNFPPLTA